MAKQNVDKILDKNHNVYLYNVIGIVKVIVMYGS
jgi:hypothetical protein